jgi:hypothetical protein
VEDGRNSQRERGLFAPLERAWWGSAGAGASKAVGFFTQHGRTATPVPSNRSCKPEANRGPGESGARSDSSTVNCLPEIRLRVWRQPICGDISRSKKTRGVAPDQPSTLASAKQSRVNREDTKPIFLRDARHNSHNGRPQPPDVRTLRLSRRRQVDSDGMANADVAQNEPDHHPGDDAGREKDSI